MRKWLIFSVVIWSVASAIGWTAAPDTNGVSTPVQINGVVNPSEVNGVSGGVASFCVGTELFCEDFEGDDPIWTTSSAQVDCSAYDTTGDYCDDDPEAHDGSESLGFYGSTTSRVGVALSSSANEVTIDAWIRTGSSVATTYIMRLWSSVGGASVVSLQTSSGGLLRVVSGATTLTAVSGALTTNHWYHIELYYHEEVGTNDGVLLLSIDGVQLISSTSVDTGSNDIDEIRFHPGTTGNIMRFDNVSITAGDSY